MSFGGMEVDGKTVMFGFSSIEDWFDSVILSFPAPWIIGDDTHYGSEIFDGRGHHIFSIWLPFGNPSARQLGDMTLTEWADYISDQHWESEAQWHLANAIIAARNYLADHERLKYFGDTDSIRKILRDLMMDHCKWSDDAQTEVACGGPDRRKTSQDPEVLKRLPMMRRSGKPDRLIEGPKEK
jgi:hypothetical protein